MAENVNPISFFFPTTKMTETEQKPEPQKLATNILTVSACCCLSILVLLIVDDD